MDHKEVQHHICVDTYVAGTRGVDPRDGPWWCEVLNALFQENGRAWGTEAPERIDRTGKETEAD